MPFRLLTTILLPFLAVHGAHENPSQQNVRKRNLAPAESGFRNPCIVSERIMAFSEGAETEEWLCEMVGEDKLLGKYFVPIKGLTAQMIQEHQIKSGETTMWIENLRLDDHGNIVLSDDMNPVFDVTDPRGPANSRRRMNANNGERRLLTGDRTALVVRVEAKDAKVGFSLSELSDSVFGTSGDAVNLSERFDSCSYGQVTVSPFKGTTNGGPNIPDDNTVGVYDFKVDTIQIKNQAVPGDLENSLVEALEGRLGDLPSQFDHVLLCVPPGTHMEDRGRWIAYAYYDSWLSVYNDDWCTYPSVLMHEIGHNLNLGHARHGGKEYGDETGMMGYSYSRDTTKRCYNAAKSWQLGLYPENRKAVTLSNKRKKVFMKLIGIEDYDNKRATKNFSAGVKLEAGSVDFYIGYNKAGSGEINSGTGEAANKVVVYSQKGGIGAPSKLVAVLKKGQTAVLTRNYKGKGKKVILQVKAYKPKSNPPHYTAQLRLE